YAALVDADGHRPVAREQIVDTHAYRAPEAGEVVVGRDRPCAFVDDARLQVVLQVFADAGELVHDGNVEAAQKRLRPHAGELQQLRRLHRTGAEQDFAARPRGVLV